MFIFNYVAIQHKHEICFVYAHKYKKVNCNQIPPFCDKHRILVTLLLEFFPWFPSMTGSISANVKKPIC